MTLIEEDLDAVLRKYYGSQFLYTLAIGWRNDVLGENRMDVIHNMPPSENVATMLRSAGDWWEKEHSLEDGR